MPYGLSRKIGGDTPGNDAKMERCVQELMAQGKSKLSAILLCKASIDKTTNRKR